MKKSLTGKLISLIIRSSICVFRGVCLFCLFVNLSVCFDLCFSEIKMLLLLCSSGECVLQCVIFKPRKVSEGIAFAGDRLKMV